MPAIFWVVLVIAALLFIISPFMHQASQSASPGNRRRAFEEADQLIATAGSEALRGMHSQAFAHYAQARDIAQANELYLLEADSSYCMAQICERNKDYKFAAQLLRQALAHRDQWEQEKPNFARLVETKLTQLKSQIQP